MKTKTIKPQLLKGSVKVPPSKSLSHRAIIAASLSKDVSTIRNIDLSDDIIATMNGMKALGADIKIKGDVLIIDGKNTFKRVKKSLIDVNESGTTLRLLMPLSLVIENSIRFIGKGKLYTRPLTIYYDIFKHQRITYSYSKTELDVRLKGALTADTFYIPGNVSSQFISGLLFSLPLLKDDSKIILTTALESKGYVDLTLDVLSDFGIKIKNKDYKEFYIKGNQEYKSTDYTVESDYSQGAFFLAANYLGSDINCLGLKKDSYQGDKMVEYILKNMKTMDVIDGKDFPDIIPILTVAAALTKKKTEFINLKRLKIKECDRLDAIYTELSKIGADIIKKEEGLIVNGVDSFTGGVVSSHDDHRIAMSLAIASTRCKEELTIINPDCVSKSYPNFWNDFETLREDICL